MFGNRIAYRTWQLVAGTLHIVVERKLRIKLRIDVFGLLHFRLFGLYTSLLSHIHIIRIGFENNGLLVFQVGNDTVSQSYSLTEVTLQHLAQQVHIVSLQILIEEGTGHPKQQSLRSRFVRLEDDGLKPSLVLVGLHCIANNGETIIPEWFWTC